MQNGLSKARQLIQIVLKTTIPGKVLWGQDA